MKYKNLKSMAHNHTHSFVSWMNHVDGVYIIDELKRLFSEGATREIVVTWLPALSCSVEPSDVLRKSMGYWADHLPSHLESHGVSAEHIDLFQSRFSISARSGLTTEAIVEDDRGRRYRQHVLS